MAKSEIHEALGPAAPLSVQKEKPRGFYRAQEVRGGAPRLLSMAALPWVRKGSS